MWVGGGGPGGGAQAAIPPPPPVTVRRALAWSPLSHPVKLCWTSRPGCFVSPCECQFQLPVQLGAHGIPCRTPRQTPLCLLRPLCPETSPILLPCEYRPWDHMLPRHYFPDGVEENSQTPFRIVRPPRKPAPLDKSARAQHSTGSKSSTRSERAAHPPSGQYMPVPQAPALPAPSSNWAALEEREPLVFVRKPRTV